MNLLAFTGVALGAVLATLGGFLATQLTARIDRRRRTRTAALLFGDVLSAIQVLLRTVGQESPPVVRQERVRLGLLRALQRELDVYSRNRESLFEIPDPVLRAKLHSFMVRLSVGVEYLLEQQQRSGDAAPAGVPGAAVDREAAESGVRFLIERHADLPDLLVLLAPYAKETFDAYQAVDE